MQSRSTPHGAPGEGNALWFDDTRGREDLVVRAQRDAHRTVGHDDALEVGGDRTATIRGQVDRVSVPTGKVEIEAGREIVLRVGETTLTLGPDGLKIEAPAVTIRSASQMTLDALTLSVQGKTSVNIEGLAVNIIGEGPGVKIVGPTVNLLGPTVNLLGPTVNIPGPIVEVCGVPAPFIPAPPP